ncbi:hypothetical protein CDAR_579341 [Caerostris darwini]|uniref:LAGLIDADG homing endonuclease n=1 Tax=Caerostris darwini TaxID=1538125 RepID=A0AAV4V2D2_9ARAC|nr:hypothetical protein CDAR_579341 [Caerostris darwini]
MRNDEINKSISLMKCSLVPKWVLFTILCSSDFLKLSCECPFAGRKSFFPATVATAFGPKSMPKRFPCFLPSIRKAESSPLAFLFNFWGQKSFFPATVAIAFGPKSMPERFPCFLPSIRKAESSPLVFLFNFWSKGWCPFAGRKSVFPATVATEFGAEVNDKTIPFFLAIYSEGGKLSSGFSFAISGVTDGYKDRKMFLLIQEYEEKHNIK